MFLLSFSLALANPMSICARISLLEHDDNEMQSRTECRHGIDCDGIECEVGQTGNCSKGKGRVLMVSVGYLFFSLVSPTSLV